METPTLERRPRVGGVPLEDRPFYLRLDDINPAHARFSMFNGLGALCGTPSDICVRIAELDQLKAAWRGGWRVLDDRTARFAQDYAPDWAIAVGIRGGGED